MTAGRSIRVQRVDTLCTRLGCDFVRLVKIEAPGSEHLVLRGMSNLLAAASAPRVLCHVSKWSPQFANEERESLINFMADYGYVPTQLGPTQIMRAPMWVLATSDTFLRLEGPRITGLEMAALKAFAARLEGAYIIQPVEQGTLIAVMLSTDPRVQCAEALAETRGQFRQ